MEQRELTRVKSLFTKNSSNSVCFITSSSDIGVSRNFGRFGARFAPQAILNEFKKMTRPLDWDNHSFSSSEVANTDLEKDNFHRAQQVEADQIFEIIKSRPKFCHLGGGHDHIYPMIKAMLKCDSRSVAIINLDAHADTRVDEEYHSGTPFRQLASEFPQLISILQIGLHEFANSPGTLTEIQCPQQKVFYSPDEQWLKQVELAITNFLVQNINSTIFISLDVDVLESQAMSAVSAVNHNGVTVNQLDFIMSMLKHHAPQAKMGIYEYNPLYEDLSNKGAKLIAHVLFKWHK